MPVYALIQDGAVAAYPYTIGELRRSTGASLPAQPSAAQLAELGVHEVLPTTPPAALALRKVVEGAPAFSAGQWRQTWVQAEMTADEVARLRASRVAAVKAERDRRSLTGGYRAAGGPYWFHSDGASRVQQLGLARKADLVKAANGSMAAPFAGPGGSPLMWKTLSGAFVTMTPDLAHAIFAAAEQQDMALFAHAEGLIAQLGAAADPMAVDITTGWPTVYGE